MKRAASRRHSIIMPKARRLVLSFLLAFTPLQSFSQAQFKPLIRYHNNSLEYWAGQWMSMNVADTTVGCGGAKPGEIRLNTTPNPDRLEFCDGTNWRRMDYEITGDACATVGEIEWSSVTSAIRYCNGANWVKTAVSSEWTTYIITTGTTWTVPADWKNTENIIEVIGGGGGGEGGAGGGGGAYSRISNATLTPGSTVTIQVGAGGGPGANGQDSYFCNSTSNCASISGAAVVVGAKGGTGGGGWGAFNSVAGGSAAAGVGTVKYSGGASGSSPAQLGISGGGGAGGPNGNGARGGDASGATDQGGGGGGGGGGTAGTDPGPGGNNYLGAGSGATGKAGTNGGGGGGSGGWASNLLGGDGGAGTEWGTAGSGGGGGGGGEDNRVVPGGNGGLYGGGGGGFRGGDSGKSRGAQGVIVVRYKTGPDDTPLLFDFIDVYSATTSTSYEVAAVITGFDVAPLTVNVSGGDATVRKNGTGAWGSSVNVYPGDTLDLRMTSSASADTAITATVTVGDVVADWVVSTGVGPSFNYFVLSSSAMASGNLGGLAGADGLCLTDLQSANWVGKSNVVLNSSTVKAFLCDGASCNNLAANKTYSFARSGSTTDGGATFTTNGSGQGPSNSSAWNTSEFFGTATYNYWTGRASSSATLWATTSDGNHCTAWTSNSGGVNGRRGLSTSTTATRWTHGTLNTCNDNTRRLICYVDYTPTVDTIPDAFDFTDVYSAALSTQYYAGAQLWGFVGPLTASVTGGDAAIRVNSTGAWVTSGLSVSPGDILNLRMTSSGSASTAITATVTVGSVTADWRVDTGAGSDFNYFVLSSFAMNGNRGGLAGANATCLSDLQASNWLGKNNVDLNSLTVKAFLCDGTTCNNLQASKTYAFANAGSATDGGATFTTDGSGQGPGDSTAWNTSTYFGTTTYNYWTGRASTSATLWATTSDTNHCSAWTSNSSGDNGRRGLSTSTTATRWTHGTLNACNSTTRRMICVVDYTQGIDTYPSFAFTDVPEAEPSTQYEASALMTSFVGPITVSVAGGGAEIRTNGSGSWVTSGLTAYPGDYINIRMTSSANSLAVMTATVTAGTATVNWRVTTKDMHTTIFLTTTGAGSWTVPADWNDADNSIEVIGAGGGGRSGTGTTRGGGAGGGGYSKITNLDLTPAASVSYQVGAGGGSGTAGGDTYFNDLDASGTVCSSDGVTGQSVCAKGGSPPNTGNNNGGAGGAAASGVGTLKYSGGTGGASPGVSSDHLGGGGGGAAGPNGNGGNGGNSQEDGSCKGGGGGAGGGGSVGQNGSIGGAGDAGGPGGNNYLGFGGGGSEQNGVSGGGGGGCSYGGTAGIGGSGIEWLTHGAGGGGGGRGETCNIPYPRSGGLYGGGGGGAGTSGSSGAQGIVVIRYRPLAFSFLNGGFELNNFSSWNPSVAGNSGDWTIVSAQQQEGTYSARSAIPAADDESCIERVINNAGLPGIFAWSFYWKVSSEANFDYLRYYIDNVYQGQISGEVDWTQVSGVLQTNGTYTFKWCYSKDVAVDTGSDRGWIDNMVLTQLGTHSGPNFGFEWADFTNWTKAIGGNDSDWIIATTGAQEGSFAGRSGPTNDFGQSCVSRAYDLTSQSNTYLQTHYWKVSSEDNFDYLRYYIDDLEIEAISGNVAWTPKATYLEGGKSYDIKWCYTKDMAGITGDDSGYIDNLTRGVNSNSLNVVNAGFESNNATNWNLAVGGNSANWSVGTSSVHHGTYAAVSGAVGDNQNSCIERTVDLTTESGTIAYQFYWRTDSEGSDPLVFYIDNVQTGPTLAGAAQPWTRVTGTVASGSSYTFKWCYERDGSGSGGTDRGWIDSLRFYK